MSDERRIRDDAGYERTLKWMVKMSKLLLDPLTLSPAERKELQQKYDFWTRRIVEYNRGQRVLEDPGLKEFYKSVGVEFQELKSEEGQ